MKTQYKKIISTTFILILGVVIAVFWLVSNREWPEPQTPPAAQTPKPNTIGSNWRWDALKDHQSASSTTQPRSDDSATASEDAAPPQEDVSTLSFDVVGIYEKLQSVKIDDNGQVVVDDEALRALEDTFMGANLKMSPADLAELQELIRLGLPGPAGEQTAEIVGDYSRYLEARDELTELTGSRSDPESIRTQYDELAALRDAYFGPETAQQLFGERERQSRYMLEMMLLERDSELTEEEKAEAQEALAQRYQPNQPDIDNWETRYAAYQTQKQAIENAGLSATEKERQFEQLLNTHFDSDEQRKAAAKGLLTETSEGDQD